MKSSKRQDIKTILIIGSGPIVIGQACEFDYSGNQAVQALREEGYRVIVHNPNPASVMTTPESADAVYMEPLTIEHVCAIIEAEKPDAMLPTMGGQTALNVALEFFEAGLDKKYNIECIGASIKSIRLAEDRGLFKECVEAIGLQCPFSRLAKTEFEANEIAKTIGFPLVIRPSFTLGGQGGGIVYSLDELQPKIRRALALSPTHSALIEESLLGYQEFEFEVVRDGNDNALIVCSIENMDPMGIHTGDSITVAPIQTLSDKEYQTLRTAAIDIVRAVEVECGGSNVQFAYHPEKQRLLVIEMNPRVSRSSALASKATGFPIARCAAKLAVGFTLDEIVNEITGKTTNFFEPSIDYVAVKVPRFDTKKFKITELGTQMRSVGESLALGRNFPMALQKALRGVEIGVEGLESIQSYGVASDNDAGQSSDVASGQSSGDDAPNDAIVENMIATLHPKRIFAMYTKILKEGASCLSYIEEKTHIHPWFLYYLLEIATMEKKLLSVKGGLDALDKTLLLQAKKMGFTDKRIEKAVLKDTDADGALIYDMRERYGMHAIYHCVDTCAGEFQAKTPYFYSSYDEIDEGEALAQPAVAIIGSGPNRIGQGLEFDTCCTMAAKALRARGYTVVMINANPETVSTDFNISDRLYLEPLHDEDVYEVLKKEQINSVVFQLGGQTPIQLLDTLEAKGIEVFGGSSHAIHEAEHREKFSKILHTLDIAQPESRFVEDIEESMAAAEELGFPVLVRPSYVIGGQSMIIAYTAEELAQFIKHNKNDLKGKHILIDRFLENATEYDVDAVSDGTSVYIGGVLQHIEHAGIHSGDSACVYTNVVSSSEMYKNIYDTTLRIAQSLGGALGGGLKGLLNIQYAVLHNVLYVIEANPRASRTVPFISKASGVNLVEMACRVWLGEKLKDMDIFKKKVLSHNHDIAVGTSLEHFAVKEAVFSFDRFDEVDILLSPEMRSTGESIGMGASFGEAFAKASAVALSEIPTSGIIFISITGKYKESMLPLIDKFIAFGFDLVGTLGTATYFNSLGRKCRSIYRVSEGSPNVIDEIQNGKIDFIINIIKSTSITGMKDDKEIRLATIRNHIPYVTTIQAVEASIEAMDYLRNKKTIVRPLLIY